MLGPAKGALFGPRSEPRSGPNWFNPQPFFAVEAKGWKAGEPLRVGPEAAGFPGRLDTLEPGDYVAQAVVRLNPDTHKLGDGEGNAYGPAVAFSVERKGEIKGDGPIKLTVDKVVPPRKFEETERVKLVEIDSPLLSAFHHRPIKHRAAVILPKDDPKASRAALYIIPGFGGDHFMAPLFARNPRLRTGENLIRVVLDPDCGTGHHVFADSAYNGPRGKALVEELIPHIEKTFHAIPEPKARLVGGHSSGGWSSLWLQVAYPDVFGGVWSTSPDPVDFREFQKVDLYAPGANTFRDRQGKPRPIARRGRQPVLYYEPFSKMEDVIGEGGQLHSFEAVFSPLGPDGRPRPLWDRKSGAVDPETARTWEAYDIRLVLERNWKTLGPKLKGKIHVVVGDLDTFYLEGAVKLLKGSLEKLGSDAVVEVVPDRDHMTLLDATLADRFDREMAAAVGR
jgi:S-formylglutathione hydrolase FrmB